MSDKKWFKGADSDSDSDASDSSSDSGSTRSSSGDSSSSTSSSSSSSSSSGQATGAAAWMKKGGAADSDSDDGKRKSKVISKKGKQEEALIKQKESIENHLGIRDFNALLDDLEVLPKLVASKQSPLPEPFYGALKKFQDFFNDNDEKEMRSRLKNKLAVGNFNKVLRKAKKMIQEHEDGVNAYQSEDDESSSGSIADQDSHDDDDIEIRRKPRKPKKQKAAQEKEDEKKKEDEWSETAIEAKLEAIKAERGKKSSNNAELVDKLKVILGRTSEWKHLSLYVLSILLSCQLESSPPGQSMPAATWLACYECATRMMNIVQENANIIAVDAEEDEKAEKGEPRTSCYEKDGDKFKVYLTIGLHQIADILGDEYTKSLRLIDTYTKTQEYVIRLQDEAYLVDIAERMFTYYKSLPGKAEIAARMAARIMDHTYYRRVENHVRLTEKQRYLTFEAPGKKREGGDAPEATEEMPAPEAAPEGEEAATTEAAKDPAADSQRTELLEKELDIRIRRQKYQVVTADLTDLMKTLHKYVQKAASDEKLKTKALLYYIYHLAQHDYYSKARDLLLMSRRHAEHEEHHRFVNSSALMILYNRVIAQLGLAAFRASELFESNVILNELCSTPTKVKEYLGQAIKKNTEKPELDKVDRAKLLPLHLHINVDMIDGVHLVTAMLEEVPKKAQLPHDSKRRPLSKAFNKLVTNYGQQVFIGPPETTKDIVYAAFLALQKGDWERTNQLITSLEFWHLIPNSDVVRKNITEHIKVVGLRTYLFTYSQYYTTVQLNELALKYDMEESKVHAIISKMILKQHLTAAWDQPKKCICVEQSSVTKLQFLAQQMSEKCTHLVDYNEQRQAEKEARQGGRGEYYKGSNRSMGGGWNAGGRGRQQRQHAYGLQKSRQVDRKKGTNMYEKREWNARGARRGPN